MLTSRRPRLAIDASVRYTGGCSPLLLLLLLLRVDVGSCFSHRQKAVVTERTAGGHMLKVIYNRDEAPGDSFHVYEGSSKTFRIWFKYPAGPVTTQWTFRQNVLQNFTHVASEKKQLSFWRVFNATPGDAGEYSVFVRPSEAGVDPLVFKFTLIVKLRPSVPLSLRCSVSIKGYGLATHLTVENSAYFGRAQLYGERERTDSYAVSFYQNFRNGSKRCINETTWKPRSSLSTIISRSDVIPCSNYSVQVTAIENVSKRSSTSLICQQTRTILPLDFSTVFRDLTGQVYLSSDLSTYVPICFSSNDTESTSFCSRMKRISIIARPQKQFISENYLKISLSEFNAYSSIQSDRYCSQLVPRCNSKIDVTRCWTAYVGTELYLANATSNPELSVNGKGHVTLSLAGALVGSMIIASAAFGIAYHNRSKRRQGEMSRRTFISNELPNTSIQLSHLAHGVSKQCPSECLACDDAVDKTKSTRAAVAPFSMKYVFQSCATFELLVGSKQLSFKLEESTSNEISRSKGGEIELSNSGIVIEFPPDALQEVNVTISASIFVSSEPIKGRFVSLLELLPHGIKFNRPVVIRSYYHVAGSRGFDSKLHLFYSSKFRSETFLDYVGELSETSAEASYSKMDYFLRDEFLEIRALSFCNLCAWSEGPCNVALSAFRKRGNKSKFGMTVALSCAHPDVLRKLKRFHVKENNESFLTSSVCTWDESWKRVEVVLEGEDEWRASGKATFTIDARNTVMKRPGDLYLGPTRGFVLTGVSDIEAGISTLQFNVNAYTAADPSAAVDVSQIILEIDTSSTTNIVPWNPDSDTLSVHSHASSSSGNFSAGSCDSWYSNRSIPSFRDDCERRRVPSIKSAEKECDKVTRDQCNALAKLISKNWQDVARKLSFSEQDINSIKVGHPQNPADESLEMLHQWLDREGSEATVSILCKALIASKARDHAESVFGDKLVTLLVKSLVDVLEV